MIPIESAIFMATPDNTHQPIYNDFKRLLPEPIEITKKKRFDFYAQAKSPDTGLVIATGESRRFANILLTIGVVK